MSLKEIILNNLPEGLTDVEKARYVYIELGKRLTFSTTFNNTDSSTHAMMYSEKVDINTFNKKQVNCRMWASLYSQFLTELGIKNNIIDQGHQHVEFYINDTRWVADATYSSYHDLARIHNNDDTAYFGPALYQKDSRKNMIRSNQETLDMLKAIDEKIQYSTDKRKKVAELKELLTVIQTDNFNINDLIKETKGTEDRLVLLMDYLFSKLGTLTDGFYEAKDFTKNLIRLMLTREQRDRVEGIELKRTNEDKEVDIVQCISVEAKDKIHYYLLAPNLPIKKIEEEELIYLAVLGYGTDDEKIPGIDYPKKFTPGKISTNFSYKIKKSFVPKNMRIYDANQNRSTISK